MRAMRTAEQIVLSAFRGRTYVTIAEVIALVEEVMAAASAASCGAEPRSYGAHGPAPHRRRRKVG
jgi:hypothetical protein